MLDLNAAHTRQTVNTWWSMKMSELLKRHVCHVRVSGSCVCLRGGGFLLYFCSSMDLLPAHVGPLSLVFQCWSDATRRRCRSFMMSWDDLPGWLDRLNTTNSSKVTHVSIWLRTRGRFACAAVTNPDELNRLRLLDDAASAGSDTLTWNVSVVGSSATWHTCESRGTWEKWSWRWERADGESVGHRWVLV